jgi:excisionase family DNA binding protein
MPSRSQRKQAESLGITSVARALQLSETTVRRLADTGKLTFVRDSANRRLFQLADVVAFRHKRAKK